MFLDGQQPQTVTLSGVLGLNTATHPSDISENELSLAYNVWFEPLTGRLVTRGGLRCFDAPVLPNPITLIHNYIRKPDEQWLMAVSGSNLYFLDVTATPTWTLLSALDIELPQMRTFNGVLYVADNSTSGLLKFEGTSASRLSGSPKNCTALYEIGNSLVANSNKDSELDAVYISAAETDDFDPANGAVIVRAGFGDGMVVNGFSAISDTLVVSKIARTEGKISKKIFYGIDVSDATRSAWSATYLSKNNASLNAHAIVSVAQEVYYCDVQGIESLTTTDKYGDIATDPEVGGKINNEFRRYSNQYQDTTKAIFMSNLASIFFLSGDRIFLLSMLTKGFTEIDLGTQINSVEQYGDLIILAGDNGQVYFFTDAGTDELEAGVLTEYVAKIAFKQITGSGQLLLRKTQIDNSYLINGSYSISAFDGERPEVAFLQQVDFQVDSSLLYLHDAINDLSEATYFLSGSEFTPTRQICRSPFRGDGITIQISTKNGGRMAIGSVRLELTAVGR